MAPAYFKNAPNPNERTEGTKSLGISLGEKSFRTYSLENPTIVVAIACIPKVYEKISIDRPKRKAKNITRFLFMSDGRLRIT